MIGQVSRKGLGLASATVRKPEEIEPALARAMQEDGPFLIDFKTEKNCPTPVYDFSAEVQRWSYHE